MTINNKIAYYNDIYTPNLNITIPIPEVINILNPPNNISNYGII